MAAAEGDQEGSRPWGRASPAVQVRHPAGHSPGQARLQAISGVFTRLMPWPAQESALLRVALHKPQEGSCEWAAMGEAVMPRTVSPSPTRSPLTQTLGTQSAPQQNGNQGRLAVKEGKRERERLLTSKALGKGLTQDEKVRLELGLWPHPLPVLQCLLPRPELTC